MNIRMSRFSGAAALLVSLLLAGTSQAGDTYEVDPAHSTVGFTVQHLVISKVSGAFADFSGTVELDAKGAIVKAEATGQAKSVDTRNEKRDEHLRGADFFDVAKFPTLSFKSTAAKDVDGKKVLEGELTIHGVTKTVSAPYELTGPIVDPWGKTRVGIAAGLTIKRSDYGLTWNKALETGGMVVSDEVVISVNLEAVKKVAEVAKPEVATPAAETPAK